MENENIIIEEAVVAEGEEIVIEEVPADAIDVVVEEEVEETAEEAAEECEECTADILTRKCQEVKDACCNTIDRIINDLKETDYNPYIKQTRTTRIEIYRDGSEEELIDTIETTDVKSYSAKALLVATAAAALLVATSGRLVKKLLK